MEWNEIVAEAERIGIGPKSILQEELQKAVLAFLSNKGTFQTTVFQGGTALRLFYGNPRFSEDIDLVVREGSDPIDLHENLKGVDRSCKIRLPFLTEFDVRSQKHDDFLQRVILKAKGEMIDIRLHIETANVPSYFNRARSLDYPPILPAVRVEDPSEILADKVRALAYRPYLKGRDLWDIHFLSGDRSNHLDWDLVRKKVLDYREPVEELDRRLFSVRDTLREKGTEVLEMEMKRFLPGPVLEGFREEFPMIIDAVVELISKPSHPGE